MGPYIVGYVWVPNIMGTLGISENRAGLNQKPALAKTPCKLIEMERWEPSVVGCVPARKVHYCCRTSFRLFCRLAALWLAKVAEKPHSAAKKLYFAAK